MPKIIENLENRLIAEAKRQMEESGYGSVTIRSVAQGCGVGVGTVYNYFSSKDELLAKFMLSDWKECVMAIQEAGIHSDTALPVARCIYDQLNDFARRNQAVFRDEAAAVAFSGAFSRYHKRLRSQLASPLRKFCGDDFAADFIAEALLTWTMAERSFDEIYGMIGKLL